MIGNHKSLLELKRELRERNQRLIEQRNREWQEMVRGERVWPGGDKMMYPTRSIYVSKDKVVSDI